MLTNPGEQLRELQQALTSVAGSADNRGVAALVASDVLNGLMQALADRAGLQVDTLFPMRRALLRAAGSTAPASSGTGSSGLFSTSSSMDDSMDESISSTSYSSQPVVAGTPSRAGPADVGSSSGSSSNGSGPAGSPASLRTPGGSSIKMRTLGAGLPAEAVVVERQAVLARR
jgi:hypothetical protein